MTYIVSKLFGTLFQEGFCIKEAEQEQVSNIEDDSGTGMGEGQGKTDVSHEIENEDQLLGSSQKVLNFFHPCVNFQEEVSRICFTPVCLLNACMCFPVYRNHWKRQKKTRM